MGCCREGRKRPCCAADIAVPLSSRRGEPGCLEGRPYAAAEDRCPAFMILRFEGICAVVGDVEGSGVDIGDGTVRGECSPRDGAVLVTVQVPGDVLVFGDQAMLAVLLAGSLAINLCQRPNIW